MGVSSSREIYEFGEFRLDAARHQLLLKAEGRALPLTSKAFETLLIFVQRPGELLDKDTLMKKVWPSVVVEENNLTQSISALRRVLGDTRDQHRFIVTLPGQGYRFVHDVKRVDEDEVTPVLASPASNSRQPDAAPPSDASADPPSATVAPAAPLTAASSSQEGWGRGRWIAFGIAVGLILLAGALWVGSRSVFHADSASTQAASSPSSVTLSPDPAAAFGGPRLAVLPFTNLSPDPANAFFADGLHEEILSALSERVAGVAVISRTTMMSYRQTTKPLRTVARELGATHVIEGTVRREGERVRLTLQLVDAGADRYLWSQSYERALASAMTLQAEVAGEVATQLSTRLTAGAERSVPITRDPAAYDLYLRALLAFRDMEGDSKPKLQATEKLLNGALERDPEFALAYAQRARLHTLSFVASTDVSEANHDSILRDLDEARRRAPHDPIVLAAVAYYLLADGEIDLALEQMSKAEAAGLRSAEFLIPKARMLLCRGRIAEMLRVDETMLSLDPANPLVVSFALSDFLVTRRTDAALRVADVAGNYMGDMAGGFRGFIQFATRGDVGALTAMATPIQDALDALPPGTADSNLAAAKFFVRRYEKRYEDIIQALSRISTPSVPYVSGMEFDFYGPVGDRPLAEIRGWTYLLLNDRVRAKAEGREVLAFVARQRRTKWNDYLLPLLEAEGYTFTGQREAALQAARAGLALMPRSKDALAWIGATTLGARVFAWNDAGDDAVALLEQLLTEQPGMLPGQIARDPLYTVSLARNPRFQTLLARLEEQMRNYRSM
jgi:TolB-like protein/DNA-binding winged helix-turn-helix (wHTH) protein